MTIKKIDKKLNQQLDWLIEPSLQGVNTLFVLSFEDEAQKKKVTDDIIFGLQK